MPWNTTPTPEQRWKFVTLANSGRWNVGGKRQNRVSVPLLDGKRHGNDHGIELGEGHVGQQGCPTLWTTNSRF